MNTPPPKNEQDTRLAELLREMQEIYDAKGEGAEAPPLSAIRKAANRICCKCDKRILKNEIVKRGCHERCYKTLLRRVEKGEQTDGWFVANGYWLPPAAPGPKPEPLPPRLPDPESEK